MTRRLASLGVLVALLLPVGSGRAFSPTFTLVPPSPTLGALGVTPAVALGPAVPPVPGVMPPPLVAIPPGVLGLVAGDVITGLSFGVAVPAGPGMQVYFSVSPASAGIALVPPPPTVSCEAAGAQAAPDVFVSQPAGPVLPAPDIRVLDGNGLPDSPCGVPAGPGLGLLEPAGAPSDDIASLEMCASSFAFLPGVGLTTPVFFALAPGSPTLGVIGATPADILVTAPPGGGPPAVAVGAAALGLAAGDAIDAIDVGPGVAWFSLAPGSPSLGACGISAASLVMGPGAACAWPVLAPAGLGLLFGDNLDAVSVAIDTDMDFVADACDSCPLVPNNDQADLDADGIGNACDSCETLPNTALDPDMDGVDSACDTCTLIANPPIAGAPPAPPRSSATSATTTPTGAETPATSTTTSSAPWSQRSTSTT